jgi:hypothetical protein
MQHILIIIHLSSILCCLVSVVCCLWSANGPFTPVENPLQIRPFYAKQTQFPKKSNERKLTNNNEL